VEPDMNDKTERRCLKWWCRS